MQPRGGETETVCPVCTLFLRPGITLKQHLASHPKQKVIDALVKISLIDGLPKSQQSQSSSQQNVPEAIFQHSQSIPQMAPYMNQVAVGNPVNNMGSLPGNHFFMYQQSMSTSSPHQSNVVPMPSFNPFAQQYLVPAVYPQMMPYIYQQQQLIMSSNGLSPLVRALPFDASNMGQVNRIVEVNTPTVSRPSDLTVNDNKEKAPEKDSVIEKIHEKEEQEQVNSNHLPNRPVIEENITIVEPSNLQQKATETPLMPEEDPLSLHLDSEQEDSDSLYKNEDQERAESVNSQNENFSDNDSLSHNVHENDNDSEFHTGNIIDHEECIGTPISHASNSGWTFSHHDLNKACQTQTSNTNISLRSSPHNESPMIPEQRSDYFFIDHRSNISDVYTSEDHSSYELSEPIYTSANIINNTEGMEFMTVDEIEGMQVIIGDFSNSSLVPPTDNYEDVRPENPPILMTISGVPMVSPRHHQQSETNIEILEHKILANPMEDNCLENVNIRSDEKMPARGELSGQESLGSTSDVTWNQIQHYQEQGGVGCYEHNSWDSSEGMHSYVENTDRKEHISTVDVTALKQEVLRESEPPITMEKCKLPPKPIGLDINKKKVKKLTIKPKKPKKETLTNFDNVFTSRLKVETNEEEMVDDMGLALDNKDGIKVETKPPVVNMCKSCDKLFKTKKELLLHNKEFHKQQRMKMTKCKICDEVFDMEHKFNEHLRIHPLECRICGKLFYRRQGMKLHTARHLGLKPFKCDLCDKAFLVKQKLEEHRNCHTGNSPIKCSMCSETFKRHSNLVQHRNKHHFMIKRKIKDYICSCGEVFHSKKKLAWHKEIHDSKPKACTQCSEKFIHMASLTRHMRRAHNAEFLPDDRNPAVSNTECPVCKGVYLKSSLDAHLKTHTNQRPFHCTICTKEFTTKWNLKLHKWTHASRTQKPFKCEMCRGAFIRENDYISHMNSHKSVRPYTCNYCGAQFIRKYNCQRHVKEHENDKTYNCNVCGKSFHRSYYLKDHMRVHSGVRPYSCHICGKTSTTKSNHNKHVQIHHAREPVSTEN